MQRLVQDVPRLRERTLGGVDEQQRAVHDVQRPLDLTAEVGVAGRVHDVDAGVLVGDRPDLRHDRDALLALEVHRVHDAVDELPRGR